MLVNSANVGLVSVTPVHDKLSYGHVKSSTGMPSSTLVAEPRLVSAAVSIVLDLSRAGFWADKDWSRLIGIYSILSPKKVIRAHKE